MVDGSLYDHTQKDVGGVIQGGVYSGDWKEFREGISVFDAASRFGTPDGT